MSRRRSVLQALAALAIARPALAQAPRAPDAASFGTLSAAITGLPPPDASVVERMLRAFATPVRRAPLRALAALVASTPAADLDAALAARKLDTLANDLAAAWYSGVVDGKVVLYEDALMWAAMSFTKPMGTCGGATGYWADAPA